MTTERVRHVPIADLGLLCVLAMLWGSSYAFIKLGVASIPPVTLIAARTTIAGLLLLAVMRWRGVVMPLDRQTWGRFLVQALLNSVVPFTLLAWAQQTVDAGLATILNSTSPIFTFLLTWAIVRHEPVTWRKLFGVVAGVAGITLVIGTDVLSGIGRQLLPQLTIVAATMCYAGAAVFGRTFQGMHAMAPAAGSLLSGAALLLPVSLLVDQPWTVRPSLESVLALLALSLLSTALGLVIYFRLIGTIGSVGTTSQAYLRVPVGVTIAVVFLGEALAPTAWIGLVCVMAGVAAMTIPGRGRRRSGPDYASAPPAVGKGAASTASGTPSRTP